ncbi:MAG: trypsin-like peptidase domain-containing protein, partial [Bacillota bacterium]
SVIRRPARPRLPDNDFLRRFFHGFGQNQAPGEDQNSGEDQDSGENQSESSSSAVPGRTEQFKRIGLGSGVIMDVDGRTGYIVTNRHVVAGASSLDVTLNNGKTIEKAQVIGTDSGTDLAIVKIEADGLKPATWGSSASMQPGDFILTFGAPLGYVGSMTHGIISAVHREVGLLGPYGYENFIQVDAPINPGNSGGPLVNLRGEVIGINIAIASESGGSEGVGFAVPSDQARTVYRTLREKGQVVRGWLGLQIADVSTNSREAQASGYNGQTGVIVKGVLRSSPAQNQLQPGDIITTFNGQNVDNARDLRSKVAAAAPGAEVKLQVFRNGKAQEMTVRVGEQPSRPTMASAGEPQPEAEKAQSLGMRITDVSNELAQKAGVDVKTGALVTAVERGSLAAEAGIGPGDVITRINDQPVRNAQEVQQIISKANLDQGLRIFVTNREGSEVAFVRRPAR